MIADLMRSRRTIRRFQDAPLERALVEELIELAITAPSASNNQPWRFFLCDDPRRIQEMARAVQEAVDRLCAQLDGEAAVAAFQHYGDYFVRFARAPLIVAPAWRPLEILSHLLGPGLDEGDRQRVVAMERTSGLSSTSLAVQNLLLAAHDRGLGASCLTGPLVAADRLCSLLSIPLGWELAMLVALGYPDESPPAPPRKKAKSVMRWVERP